MGFFSRYPSSFTPRRVIELTHALSNEKLVFSPTSDIFNFLEEQVLCYGSQCTLKYRLLSTFLSEIFLTIFIAILLFITFKFKLISRIKPRLFKADLLEEQQSCPFFLMQKGARNLNPKQDQPLHLLPPYVFPPLKPPTSPHMTMALKRLDRGNWLAIDDTYLRAHSTRAALLRDHKPSVLACIPSSELACREVLSLVSTFLSTRYPSSFRITSSATPSLASPFAREREITNRLTGERFALDGNTEPLETAARLAMEDFNVLARDEVGEYRLMASATLFPAGWNLRERIGGTLATLHGPVPRWRERLGCNVNKYLDHLTDSTAMERHAFFVQFGDALFQSSSLASTSTTTSSPSTTSPSLAATTVHIRRERQTFVPLAQTSAATGRKTGLFSVRTYLVPITDLETTEIEALLRNARGWSDDEAAFKGRESWIGAVEGELRGRGESGVSMSMSS